MPCKLVHCASAKAEPLFSKVTFRTSPFCFLFSSLSSNKAAQCVHFIFSFLCTFLRQNLSEARDGSSEAHRDKCTSGKPEVHGAEVENNAAPVENGHLSPVLLDVSDISDDVSAAPPCIRLIGGCKFGLSRNERTA